jgi:two-component system, OmpR family, copper resistance phosphate regulon response regulator CusR
MRILVIEDERKVANLIAEGLREEHFEVDCVFDGEEGLYRAKEFSYGLAILDLHLPKRDGWTILQALRAEEKPLRVLVLTAQDDVSDRVRGLELGADDYLTKPFAFEELLARVRALLRRGHDLQPEVLTAGPLTLDSRRHRVTRAGATVELSPKEFAVLEYLLRHADEVVSRQELVEHVWDENFESFSNVIDVTLHHLRDKVDVDPAARLIHTVRGVGYVLRKESGRSSGFNEA